MSNSCLWRGVRMMGMVGVCVAALGCIANAHGQFVLQTISSSTDADPLARPVMITHAPGDYGRMFVVQKGGQIRIIDLTTQPSPTVQASATPFLNLMSSSRPALLSPPQVPANNSDERGTLGVAFHPQFQTNGKFYVYYSSTTISGLPTNYNYTNNVVEFIVRDPNTHVVNPALNVADLASARIVLRVQHPNTYTNHNAGGIGFGPDGYLYITTGDGGNGGDVGPGHNATIGNAQDTGILLGKMLRLDVNSIGPVPQGVLWTGTNSTSTYDDSVVAYGIPADNPTLPVVAGGASPARREIWAYGLRNPWKWSFDRLTGDLWIGDVGQDVWEEIDYAPAYTGANAAQVAGRNYGWRCFEGTSSYSTNNGMCPAAFDTTGLTPPLGVYSHTSAQAATNPPRMMSVAGATGNAALISGCAVIGGYVYRGCHIPELYGQYVFTDYCGGTVYSTTINAATGVLNNPTALTWVYDGSTDVTPNVPPAPSTSGAVSFGEDAYGELYMVVQAPPTIYKFVSTHAGTIPLANADFDRNGTLSVQDIFSFLNAWFQGSSLTDYNRDGVLSVQDIFDFLNGWFGSCPG